MKGKKLCGSFVCFSIILSMAASVLSSTLFTAQSAYADSISLPTADYSEWEGILTNIYPTVLNDYPQTSSFFESIQYDANAHRPWGTSPCDIDKVVNLFFAPDGSQLNIQKYTNEYDQDIIVAYADNNSVIYQYQQYFCGSTAATAVAQVQSSFGYLQGSGTGHSGLAVMIARNGNIDYPYKASGYQNVNFIGIEPPTATNVPPGERTIVRPDYKWIVTNRHLEVIDTSNPPEDTKPFKVKWLITVGDIDASTGNVRIYESTVDPGKSASLDLDRYDNVGIQAIYYNQDGTPKVDTAVYDFRETDVTFRVDGSSFVGTTEGSHCDAADHCTQPAPAMYEDCSPYFGDLKVVEGFQCVMGNFQKWLVSIFIPDPRDISRYLGLSQTWAREHLGFVYQFSEWLSTTFIQAFQQSHDVVCLHNFGNFFGQPFVFNQCQLEDTSPQAWGVVTMIVRSTAVFAVLIMWWRQVRKYIRDGTHAEVYH